MWRRSCCLRCDDFLKLAVQETQRWGRSNSSSLSQNLSFYNETIKRTYFKWFFLSPWLRGNLWPHTKIYFKKLLKTSFLLLHLIWLYSLSELDYCIRLNVDDTTVIFDNFTFSSMLFSFNKLSEVFKRLLFKKGVLTLFENNWKLPGRLIDGSVSGQTLYDAVLRDDVRFDERNIWSRRIQ